MKKYKSKYFNQEIPEYTYKKRHKTPKDEDNLNLIPFQWSYFNIRLRISNTDALMFEDIDLEEDSELLKYRKECAGVFTSDLDEDTEWLPEERLTNEYGHGISLDLNQVIPILERLDADKIYIGSHWGLWRRLNAIIFCPHDDENYAILKEWLKDN